MARDPAVTSVRLRGGGGSLFIFDLPLHPSIEGQVRRGELVPVDDASRKLVAQHYAPRRRGLEALPTDPRIESMSFAGDGIPMAVLEGRVEVTGEQD